MPRLILLRHGESSWNRENRFTGWVDVPLSAKGEEESRCAGEKLKGYKIDKIYTSVLKRAVDTVEISLKVIGINPVIERDRALNERHYGDLQGLNKAETIKRYGEAQVQIWRRSYDVQPPNGESLKDTVARVLPYWKEKILPDIRSGKNVLVVAHGNSLRALVMHLDGMSKEDVIELNIPTGVPIVYDFDENGNIVKKTEVA